MITFFKGLRIKNSDLMNSLGDIGHRQFIMAGSIETLQLSIDAFSNKLNTLADFNELARKELRDGIKIIDKRNSDLVGLLTKYFELEKMKAEKQVAEQEANKPTEDDTRF